MAPSACRKGGCTVETHALDHIYRQYGQDLYRYLCSLAASPQVAEDLMQDTFYKAYVYLDSYDNERIKPWLFKVAYHAFIDWQRKERRSTPFEPEWMEQRVASSETARSAEQEVLAREAEESWMSLLGRLAMNKRHVVLLRDHYQLSYQEIADITGLSISSVKINIHRGREELRRLIQHIYGGGDDL
ncbi:sigma-70 family RNA polymerase sigma factor [Paenibacillus paeoniae]|uniref:RNA polymerase subunit sigma n=1 Tax=Paenibacillus paeoniae TaxID=2292705 RepID=A0A371PI93_9BACL|nr:sigma-70 family RNA polymerase sigma factor [Paenibacillus paeoniae]REK75100.1 RNA polymerase subunit sigma [Paenibacillus paeoniae]